MLSPILFGLICFLLLLILLTWVAYRIFYKPGKFLKQLGRPVIHFSIPEWATTSSLRAFNFFMSTCKSLQNWRA